MLVIDDRDIIYSWLCSRSSKGAT